MCCQREQDQNICAICQYDIKQGEECKWSGCCHEFHRGCAALWIEAANHDGYKILLDMKQHNIVMPIIPNETCTFQSDESSAENVILTDFYKLEMANLRGIEFLQCSPSFLF